ncbi:hypothetical protein PRZ48_003272 [Zasmidium cellare]|uniref:LysM domain-containing protein n=1 Tax=Zasmidium cellare TaxID=395010 RepID=A0ABR0EUL1_ZASCE|nr:hypothetical protein PRZ48_003272 [Zasmidium cellare]
MVSITAAIIALLLAISPGPGSVSAQQFNGMYRPVSFPGITHSCFSALNSTLDCSFLLWEASYREPVLAAQNHSDLICTTSCLESLFAAQKAAAKACISDTDVIWDNHLTVATPAKWIIDRLLYNFNESCVVDHVTGKLCASVLQSLPPSNARGFECSQCALDMMDMKLKSPLRYSKDEAEKFNSSITSCSATGYTVTSPSPTTTNATHPDRSWIDAFLAAPTPKFNENCTRWRKVRPKDTYNSIAMMNGVSAFWLRANDYNVDADFDEILPVGTSYCLPPGSCHVYKLRKHETCEDISRRAGHPINSTQLEKWNPKISEVCNDSARLNGAVRQVGQLVAWKAIQCMLVPRGTELMFYPPYHEPFKSILVVHELPIWTWGTAHRGVLLGQRPFMGDSYNDICGSSANRQSSSLGSSTITRVL